MTTTKVYILFRSDRSIEACFDSREEAELYLPHIRNPESKDYYYIIEYPIYQTAEQAEAEEIF